MLQVKGQTWCQCAAEDGFGGWEADSSSVRVLVFEMWAGGCEHAQRAPIPPRLQTTAASVGPE